VKSMTAPDRIRSLPALRLAALGKDDRHVLAHAALLGYRFDPATLALALRRDVETLVGSLQRARDCDLIVEERTSPRRFRFQHAIVRASLIDGISPGNALRLHRKIVRALEALPDIDSHVDELAYHAREGRLAVKTFIYSERAGDAATAVRALTDAARYYDWALVAADGPTARARLRYKIASLARLGET